MPPLNSTTKVFGKSIQPKDYAYQAKIQKDTPMMENTMKPINHQLLGEVFYLVKRFKSATAHYIADNMHSTIEISDIQPVLNRLVQTGKLAAQPNAHGEMEYSVAVDEAVMETSMEKLTKYKTAAAADAGKADKEGDYKRADKRFSGIVKATKKQFANDAKKYKGKTFEAMFEGWFDDKDEPKKERGIDKLARGEKAAAGDMPEQGATPLSIEQAQELNARYSQQKPINTTQAQWDKDVRDGGLEFAQGQDLETAKKNSYRDFSQQYDKDKQAQKSGDYSQQDTGASKVDIYGRSRPTPMAFDNLGRPMDQDNPAQAQKSYAPQNRPANPQSAGKGTVPPQQQRRPVPSPSAQTTQPQDDAPPSVPTPSQPSPSKKFDNSDATDVPYRMKTPPKLQSTNIPRLKESFSRMFGSSRTSQQTLENVVIKVRHRAPVNEESRGSRVRDISAIFLECNGERFRFPHISMTGARAMAQHMAHGGTFNDKVGSYISESVGNLLKLQSFNRYVTTNNLINEDSSGIVETVKENIETIRTELKKLTGTKTYETTKARLETFERETLAEDDTSGLKDLFTIRRFDEKFEEVLPIVKQLVQEKDTYHKRIEEAAGNVVIIRRESINTTPMFEFASENARLGFKINELALRIMENDELAGFIGKIGTKLCKEGVVNEFEKAVLTQVLENVAVEEKSTGKKEIKESAELQSYFDRFDRTFM